MKITEEMVDRCAELSRLTLVGEERTRMTGELERILEYMDRLAEVDTAGIEPLAYVLPLKNVLRADEVAPSMDAEDLLSSAPERDGQTYLVPRAVD